MCTASPRAWATATLDSVAASSWGEITSNPASAADATSAPISSVNADHYATSRAVSRARVIRGYPRWRSRPAQTPRPLDNLEDFCRQLRDTAASSVTPLGQPTVTPAFNSMSIRTRPANRSRTSASVGRDGMKLLPGPGAGIRRPISAKVVDRSRPGHQSSGQPAHHASRRPRRRA